MFRLKTDHCLRVYLPGYINSDMNPDTDMTSDAQPFICNPRFPFMNRGLVKRSSQSMERREHMYPRERVGRLLRRKVETYGDPYLLDIKPEEVAVCRECHSVYASKRWELDTQAANDLAAASHVVDTLCPACQKIRDRMPGGVVTLSGAFMGKHEQEIMNLLNHENREAMEINPLERIMDIEELDSSLVVQTTNEKLAQRIGRAMYKAYGGDVEYKWSKGTKLARVNWHRD
jgi:hypothetical protein